MKKSKTEIMCEKVSKMLEHDGEVIVFVLKISPNRKMFKYSHFSNFTSNQSEALNMLQSGLNTAFNEIGNLQ